MYGTGSIFTINTVLTWKGLSVYRLIYHGLVTAVSFHCPGMISFNVYAILLRLKH